MQKKIRLGVNIDHVATIRNARGGEHPCPSRAAIEAEKSGADGITAHLREDRRHISDLDIEKIKQSIKIPLNFEMAATNEMLEIALRTKPNAACIVPEKRQERTTEGGLDIVANFKNLAPIVKTLNENNIKTSLFINPENEQVLAAQEIGAKIVEFHTGTYCHLEGKSQENELEKIMKASKYADSLGLECHAGHGLCFKTAGKIAAIPEIIELNIGHFLIGEAIFIGLEHAIKKMRLIIENELV